MKVHESKLSATVTLPLVFALQAGPAYAETSQNLTGAPGESALLVRRVPGSGPSVLYIHGASFPSALSVAYKIDGRSWMDDLNDRGFDVWAFDFAGFGGSERPATMVEAVGAPYISGGPDAVAQLGRVVDLVRKQTSGAPVILLAHSWGTLPSGAYASAHPEAIRALILFGPLAPRHEPEDKTERGPSVLVSAEEQWQNFRHGLPLGQPSLFRRDRFETWVKTYLGTDPAASTRVPPAVLVPTGPEQDVSKVWAGAFPYDPSKISAPVLIVRGEWDAVATDSDAAWYRAHLTAVRGGVRDIKLLHGGHRMHLEENRQALFDTVGTYLGHLSA